MDISCVILITFTGTIYGCTESGVNDTAPNKNSRITSSPVTRNSMVNYDRLKTIEHDKIIKTIPMDKLGLHYLRDRIGTLHLRINLGGPNMDDDRDILYDI